MSTTPAFQARDLVFRFPGAARPAVDGVALRVPRGSLTAVIGPNGSGKSTLLRLLLGVLRPGSGAVRYGGRDLADWSRRELARRIGVVPQVEELAFPISVRELVAMGRYPHLGTWRSEGPEDRRAVDGAMARCDVLELAERPVATLSGGERQRARLARALAQQPEALVLDEPTTALDIRHEMEIFELLRRLTDDGAVTVLVVTHHLNLAARYAERLLLLDRGRPAAEGTPHEVLTLDTVQRVYRWSVAITEHAGPGRDAGAPQVVPLANHTEGEPT